MGFSPRTLISCHVLLSRWIWARPRIRGCPSSMGLGSQLGVSPGPVVFACRAGFGFFCAALGQHGCCRCQRAALLPALPPAPLFPCSRILHHILPRNLGSFPELSPPSPALCAMSSRVAVGLAQGPLPRNGEVLPLLSAPFPPAAGASPCRDVPGKGNGAVFLHAACNFRRQS